LARIAPSFADGTILSGGNRMKNPLDTLWGTVICGLILTLILYNVVKFMMH
jgi:hypothetical protein